MTDVRLSDAEWRSLTEGKPRPIAIYHKGDAQAYYEASDDIRAAWNAYAQAEAHAFDNHPSRDSYDNTAVFPGWDRDGKCTPWCPPLYFPEWLERHLTPKQAIWSKIKGLGRRNPQPRNRQ